jgi:hypothetical protein
MVTWLISLKSRVDAAPSDDATLLELLHEQNVQVEIKNMPSSFFIKIPPRFIQIIKYIYYNPLYFTLSTHFFKIYFKIQAFLTT